MEDNTTISPATEPVGSVPMSEDEGERAIANLLDGNLSKADPAQSREAQTATDASDEDDEGVAFESEEEGDEPEGQQAPAPATVGDDVLVTLQDGSQISIGDLKRNNLFQRDYSQKTEALNREKESLHKEVSTWRETEQQRLSHEREQIMAVAAMYLPKAPNPNMLDERHPDFDPVTHMIENNAYQMKMGQLNELWQRSQQEQQQATAKQQEEAAQNRVAQQAELFQRLPKLKDDAKRQAFAQEISDILPRVYKVNAKDVELIENAGYMHIVHDAIAYQKLKAKSVQVTTDLAQKPKLEGKQRSTPQSSQQRDEKGRFETLRSTGSVEAADRAIEAFLRRG